MAGTLVLNACGTYLASVPWQRAVTLVVLGQAVVHEADPHREVRSPSLAVPFPRAVRLVRWTRVGWSDRHGTGGVAPASKAGVLRRDGRTCVYCGQAGLTVDHVLPQSRGGRSSWDNLAACCAECNGRKGARTPQEAGMRLRWEPWEPDDRARLQREVWAALARGPA